MGSVARQPVGHRDQDVQYAARAQIVEHLHPELRTLRGLDPQTQDFAGAIPAHAQRQIYRFVAHNIVFPDLHPQRIEKHNSIDCFQRSALPGRDLRQQPVGHRADELRADLGTIDFNQIALNFPHRQTTGIQCYNAVVEGGETAGMLGQQQRFELPSRSRGVSIRTLPSPVSTVLLVLPLRWLVSASGFFDPGA